MEMLKRAWKEFLIGWCHANWGIHVTLVFLPLVLLVTLIVQIARGEVPPAVVRSIVSFAAGALSGVALAVWALRHRITLQRWTARLRVSAREATGQYAGAKGGEVSRRR